MSHCPTNVLILVSLFVTTCHCFDLFLLSSLVLGPTAHLPLPGLVRIPSASKDLSLGPLRSEQLYKKHSPWLNYKTCHRSNKPCKSIYIQFYTMVAAITSASDFDKAIAVDKLVVVDFFAVWCGPCKMISPMVDKFSTEYTQADFYKVDVDELPEVAKKNEVSSMPTFILFKGGKPVAKVVGANPAAVKQAIASNV